MGATTSKGNQVLNVMAYKRRDAMRYLIREYEAIRRLIQVVDITIPQVNKKWGNILPKEKYIITILLLCNNNFNIFEILFELKFS